VALLQPLGSLVVAALLAAGAAACTSDDGEDAGDDRVPAPEGARCVVADPEGELILQPGTVEAEEQIRLEGVELDDATNLEIVEASAVAFSGGATAHGIILDYPPLKNAGIADSLADWDSRQPLAGAELRAADGRQAILVAVRLTDPESAGSITGVTLTSTEDGEEATRRWSQPVLAKPPGDLCTVDDFASPAD
jgi:hypothetical protein